MPLIQINPEAVEQRYSTLNSIGVIGGDLKNGFLRPPYSEAETSAINYIRMIATAGGLCCHTDGVGNLIVETPGQFSGWIETGSHIDTVPGGGNYDGTAGVVAGIEALLAIVQSSVALQRGLRLRIWRGEESATFGVTSIGSRAAFGQLDPSALQQCYNGENLADAMRQQRADPAMIHSGQATITQRQIDAITAYIELHIEQGKVLECSAKDIGIVTSIRGSKRSWITISGTFDHSGATPMGVEFRHDANLAMAHIMVKLDQLLIRANSEGANLVQTCGLINPPGQSANTPALLDNAITKVSGAVCFSFEVRGSHAERLNSYCAEAFALIRDTADAFAVSVKIDTFSDQQGVAALDSDLQRLLTRGCDALDLSHLSLDSGAWHDAGAVAQQIHSDGQSVPVAMIFIPCRDGISHSPDELSTPQQIAKGASLLASTMAELACMA